MLSVHRGSLLLVVLTFTACDDAADVAARSNLQVVSVEQGLLRGSGPARDGVVGFFGVPYAAPPTGERRWRAPAPPPSWDGERDATRFGPSCPQGDGTLDYYRRAARRLGRDTAELPGVGSTSEDCLYLNVWTPGPSRERTFPVFVWVHGGAGTTGSGADPLFRGASLARHGLVVVTVNYRLGALGFLAHPALSADDPRSVSGNYALHDLVRALRWLRQNARAFGGDPTRITVAGHSAGASLLEILLTSPAAEGLFHRAASHSASWLSPSRLRSDDAGESAESAGSRFVAHLGVAGDVTAAALRTLPADRLVDAATKAGADAPSAPVIDGELLVDDPARRWASGEYIRLPLLKGSADDEFALLMPPLPIDPAAYRTWVQERYGGLADAVLTAYPPGLDAEATRRQRVRLLSDDTFRAPVVRLLDWTEGRSPLWLYRFAWRPDDGAVGAFHGVDLPFLFGTHGSVPWWGATPEVERLTDIVQRRWSRFAAAGEPHGAGMPRWPRASPDAPLALVLDSDPQASVLPHRALLRRFAERMARPEPDSSRRP